MTDGNDPAYPTIGIQNNEESGLVGGLSKREHFAVKAEGFDADATAEFVAKCLGWSVPTFPEEMGREWFLWWRSAVAAWKVEEADALIAALNQKGPNE